MKRPASRINDDHISVQCRVRRIPKQATPTQAEEDNDGQDMICTLRKWKSNPNTVMERNEADLYLRPLSLSSPCNLSCFSYASVEESDCFEETEGTEDQLSISVSYKLSVHDDNSSPIDNNDSNNATSGKTNNGDNNGKDDSNVIISINNNGNKLNPNTDISTANTDISALELETNLLDDNLSNTDNSTTNSSDPKSFVNSNAEGTVNDEGTQLSIDSSTRSHGAGSKKQRRSWNQFKRNSSSSTQTRRYSSAISKIHTQNLTQFRRHSSASTYSNSMNNSNRNKKLSYAIPTRTIHVVEVKTCNIVRIKTLRKGSFDFDFASRTGRDTFLGFLELTLPQGRIVDITKGVRKRYSPFSFDDETKDYLDVEKLTEHITQNRRETMSERIRKRVDHVVSSIEEISEIIWENACANCQLPVEALQPDTRMQLHLAGSPAPTDAPRDTSSPDASQHSCISTLELDDGSKYDRSPQHYSDTTQTDNNKENVFPTTFTSDDDLTKNRRQILQMYNFPSGLSIEPPGEASGFRIEHRIEACV